MVGELHQTLAAEQRAQLQLWLDEARSGAGAAGATAVQSLTAVQRLLPELLRVAGTDALQTHQLSSPLQWSDDLSVPAAQRQADLECATLMLGMHMANRPLNRPPEPSPRPS